MLAAGRASRYTAGMCAIRRSWAGLLALLPGTALSADVVEVDERHHRKEGMGQAHKLRPIIRSVPCNGFFSPRLGVHPIRMKRHPEAQAEFEAARKSDRREANSRLDLQASASRLSAPAPR